MKKETEYKGYRIICRSAGRLFAQVFPPGSSKALKDTPVATLLEGCDHLLMLAHQLIDREHAKAAAINLAMAELRQAHCYEDPRDDNAEREQINSPRRG